MYAKVNSENQYWILDETENYISVSVHQDDHICTKFWLMFLGDKIFILL